MDETDPRADADAVVAVAVADLLLTADVTVAEIKATVVAATDKFAARISVRVNRRIETDVEDIGVVAGPVVAGAVVFRPGGGLNTNVGVVLRIGGGRNTSVGVEVTVAGSEWRPGVLAGMFAAAGTTKVAAVTGMFGVADLDLLGLPIAEPADLLL
jgi:hypothetical protein